MALKFSSSAKSTLAANLSDIATTLTVQNADKDLFPVLGVGDWYPLVIKNSSGEIEIVRATARTDNVITITRAQESTTATAFISGCEVAIMLTGTAFAEMMGTDSSAGSFVRNNGSSWTPHASSTRAAGYNQLYTDYGYIQLGPINASYGHIYTDRPSFYFNKQLIVNGDTVWNAGNDGTGSGLDADLLDGNHATAFATSAQGTLADNAMPKTGGTFTGAVSWATAPSTGNHLTNKTYVDGLGIGVGQTWQVVTGSRTAGTTYQNTTGKPIMVAFRMAVGAGRDFEVSADASTWVKGMTSGGTEALSCTSIVPNGWYYRVLTAYSNGVPWVELR